MVHSFEDPWAGISIGSNPDSKVHGANIGPIWGRQDPGGPHVGSMKFAIWESYVEHMDQSGIIQFPTWKFYYSHDKIR